MDEQQLESLLKRITDYLVSELDKRGDLVSRVIDLEDTIIKRKITLTEAVYEKILFRK